MPYKGVINSNWNCGVRQKLSKDHYGCSDPERTLRHRHDRARVWEIGRMGNRSRSFSVSPNFGQNLIVSDCPENKSCSACQEVFLGGRVLVSRPYWHDYMVNTPSLRHTSQGTNGQWKIRTWVLKSAHFLTLLSISKSFHIALTIVFLVEKCSKSVPAIHPCMD